MAPVRRSKVRLRRATVADIDLLVAHRLAMFREMGGRTPRTIRRHGAPYLAWLAPRLVRAEVVAWVAEDSRCEPLGSGAVWFQPTHPGPGSVALRTPYVLSMYTAPPGRRQGVATSIVRRATSLSRRLGYRRVVLHATPAGRPVYERLGFRPTSEMRLLLDPSDRARDRRRRIREATASGGPL
ncbi:MAG TPA: GNAT family N-acetyltransferase [Thermoplasmata archaeon]|nr:GNAT family N-acetyltransferase [Thermoplasmata archaeon]